MDIDKILHISEPTLEEKFEKYMKGEGRDGFMPSDLAEIAHEHYNKKCTR